MLRRSFLALFQKELSIAVSIPVFASSLTQIPLAFQMTGANTSVGVLAAESSAITDAHMAGIGVENVPVVVMGLENTRSLQLPSFATSGMVWTFLIVEDEVVEAALVLKANAPNIRSLMLECTDRPSFAARIQQELKLSVFDIITLAEMAHRVTLRSPFTGTMPW